MNGSSYEILIENIEAISCQTSPYDIGNLFQKIRDDSHNAGNKRIAELAQLEVDAFNYALINGVAESTFTLLSKDGTTVQIPNINRYSDPDLDYFSQRLEKSKNPYLRLRYSQILWSGPRKNIKFAVTIVDSSLAIVNAISKANYPDDVDIDVLPDNILKNAFVVSKNSKYKSSEVKKCIVDLCSENLNIAKQERVRLIKFISENQKEFDNESRAILSSNCWKMALETKDPNYSIDILEIGEALDSVKVKTKKWQEQIGIQYETLLDAADKPENLAAPDFCLSAIEAFKSAGNESKVAELTERYKRLKLSRKYSSTALPIDEEALKNHIKNCQVRAKELVDHSVQNALTFLAGADSILPRLSWLRKQAEDLMKNTIFGSIPKQTIDGRGHVAKHASKDDELAQSNLLWCYGFELNYDKQIQLGTIVDEAIRSGKLTSSEIIVFLKKGWLGATLCNPGVQSNIYYTWIDHLLPPIEYCIQEVRANTIDRNYVPNMIMPIDSLVLKFEGMLRDLLIRTDKGTTFKKKTDRKKRSIVREKDISDLLNEQGLKDIFSEDEVQFFKYILTDHEGLNIRGEVAHCLKYAQNYDVNQFYLLFFALLRISKFVIQIEKDSKVEKLTAEHTGDVLEESLIIKQIKNDTQKLSEF